jgi:hypothetical protein
MTDEELISYRDDVREFMIAENEADTRIFQDVSKELISRLARGRIAIEAMENIGLCISVLNDFNVKYKMNDIIEIFGNYQQSCKEATDEK